jgi:hypothetical protein
MFSMFDRALQRSVISRELTRDHLHAMFEERASRAQNKKARTPSPHRWTANPTGGNDRNAEKARCQA